MSYASAQTLQGALYTTLLAAPSITDRVGTAVFDTVPHGSVPPLYVTLGQEDALARGDGTGVLTRYRVSLAVVSEAAGFAEAKALAGAIGDVLDGATLDLAPEALLSLRFERAQARRTDRNRRRRIDLRFTALVDRQ